MFVVTDSSGLAGFLEALDVTRHAKIGFTVGVVFSALVYAYRVGEVLGPVQDQRGSPLLFVLLAFVLAMGVGVLVTVILTVRSAVRLARDLE